MKKSYPMAKNWLIYKKKADGTWVIRDILTDQKYAMGYDAIRLCRRLDGKTDPYVLGLPQTTVDEVLRQLENRQLLRHSLTTLLGSGSLRHTLWIPQKKCSNALVFRLLNRFLLLLCLPVFLFGLMVFVISSDWVHTGGMVTGLVLGIVIGAFFHECAHAIATYACGGYLFECGISLTTFFFPGAYVLIETSHIKSRWKRIQISAAGLEMNLLLAGVFWLLSPLFPAQAGILVYAGTSNLVLMLINCTFADGLDGASVMGYLLASPGWIAYAKYAVTVARKQLCQQGLSGIIELAACYIAVCAQFVVSILHILSILGVIVWVIK